MGFSRGFLFSIIFSTSAVSMLFAQSSEDSDVLDFDRIVSKAKQKGLTSFDNPSLGSPMSEAKAKVRSRTRVYTMTPFGLTNLNQSSLLAPQDGLNASTQREADAEDGKDQTAFDDLGSPLTPEHLSEFRVCKDSRTELGIDDANTYWMSALSSIAYLKYPLAFERLQAMGFEEVIFVEGPSDVEVIVAKISPKKNAKGEIVKESGLSVVAFRGSDDAFDWLTNLNATATDISEHSHEAWLHEGFALALSEVSGEILKFLDLKNNPSPLFITGHSLGGALATQLAIRLVSKPSPSSAPLIGPKDDRLRGLYVFAAPRVGNEWARNILDKYMNRTKNVAVNLHSNADPAPKAPFDWMGYKRAAVQAVIPYDSNGKVDYGNRAYWKCFNDADYRGPSAFDTELYYTTHHAHHMVAYAKHFIPWRSRLRDRATCRSALPTWGPRFEDENPSTFHVLKTHQEVFKNACEYTSFSWGGNVQL